MRCKPIGRAAWNLTRQGPAEVAWERTYSATFRVSGREPVNEEVRNPVINSVRPLVTAGKSSLLRQSKTKHGRAYIRRTLGLPSRGPRGATLTLMSPKLVGRCVVADTRDRQIDKSIHDIASQYRGKMYDEVDGAIQPVYLWTPTQILHRVFKRDTQDKQKHEHDT